MSDNNTSDNSTVPNWNDPEKIANLINRFAKAVLPTGSESYNAYERIVEHYAKVVITESARPHGNNDLVML